jgi:hypothetical protein
MAVATGHITRQEVSSLGTDQKTVRVPQWLYCFTDDQFVSWCRQHKLSVSEAVRHFADDERAAIFRYAMRQHLIN